jgi:hypothetical protein
MWRYRHFLKSQSYVAEKVQLFRDGRARTAVRRKVAPNNTQYSIKAPIFGRG